MAKKDKNEDEYKDNLDNSSMQDDEDFGLPDLEDESTTDQPIQEDEVEIEITSEEKIADERITFEEEDSIDADDNEISDDAYVGEEFESEDESEGPVGTYTPPKQSSLPILITLSIIVILACIAVYFFFIYEASPKVEKVQVPEKDTTTYVVEKPMEVAEPVIEEAEPIVEEVATINTLKVRSGRSYVIVGSFFDDDLAMDYAKQLKRKGTTSYIIPPFGKSKFTRVAVKESASFADASSMANELAGQYKEQPWPLKY